MLLESMVVPLLARIVLAVAGVILVTLGIRRIVRADAIFQRANRETAGRWLYLKYWSPEWIRKVGYLNVALGLLIVFLAAFMNRIAGPGR